MPIRVICPADETEPRPHNRPSLQASVMKAAVTCFGQVTAAVEPSQWPSAVRPFGLLLQLLLDERPKVRKRAQDAAQSVLAALQDTSARQPASDLVLKSTHECSCFP